MWFFKSKDLRDYSCDFKNSKRFWNFNENARSFFFVFRFWSTELHEPTQWRLWLFGYETRKFQNFESKDLRDYSCDFKNSKRFWNFSENARSVFFVFDFDRRNLTNELREVFAFLVRPHELLMQNWLLPLISLGLTAWKGLFWISKPIATIELRSTGINGWIALVIDFLWISQCLKLPGRL